MSLASSNPAWVSIAAHLTLAAPYVALAAMLLALATLAAQWSLRRRLARLALGRNGSIEESIAVITRELKELKEFRSEVEKYLKLTEVRLRGSLTGLGIVRFNPFEGMGQGGNQSSAIALVDEMGSGVVLSTLYSRDRVAVYTKPIEAHGSSYELTQEEKAAIERARERIAAIKKSA